MHSLAKSLVYPFFIPGGVLLGAALLGAGRGYGMAFFHAYGAPVFWSVYAAAFFLGWRFNRSRLVFAALMLVLAAALPPMLPDGGPRAFAASLVTVLLPLNLVFFSLGSEKGTFTLCGGLRFAAILAQVAAGTWLYRHHLHQALEVLNMSVPLLKPLPALKIGHAGLLAAAGGWVFFLGRFLRRPGAFEASYFWCYTAAFAALALSAEQRVLFTVAGLILLVGILESFHFMAFRDELTGLPARRALNEALDQLGKRYVVAMVDIDFFKKFNDRYGHDVGDQVLRMVATRLGGVKGGGRAFRYGGEEFSLLFPGKTVEEAMPHLEQVRQGIAQTDFSLRGRWRPRRKPEPPKARKGGGKSLRVTVSIGACERGGGKKTSAQVLKAADQALYRAKKSGRNRVCS